MNAGFCRTCILSENKISLQLTSRNWSHHKFMEMSLNHISLTDILFIEILTSLFSLFSTIIFSPTLLLKAYAVQTIKLSLIFKNFLSETLRTWIN